MIRQLCKPITIDNITYEPGLKEPETLPADPCGGGEREKGCSR